MLTKITPTHTAHILGSRALLIFILIEFSPHNDRWGLTFNGEHNNG